MKVNTSYLLAVAVIVGAEPPDHATDAGQIIVWDPEEFCLIIKI
jgi:hypothetical protein